MANFHSSSPAQDIPPPWMQGAKEISGHEMLVVHMNEGELEGLDNLQHGPSIDPETGIREYSALAPIIEMPEIRQVFQHVADELEQHGKISPDLEKIYKYSKEHSLSYKPTPEEKHNPLKAMEHTGRGGDTKLALIPLNLAFFLIELRHEPSINPTTGLLEFKFKFKHLTGGRSFKQVIKNVIPVAATVAGAFIGGPIGAGIGNALGQAATGRDLKTSAIRGAKIGALAYGAQGLGQAAGLGASTPYTGGFFGGAPNLVAKGLGAAGIGAAAPAASSAAPGMMKAGQHGVPGSIGSSHVYHPESFAGSAASGYGDYAAPAMAGVGASGMMGNSSGNQSQQPAQSQGGLGGFMDTLGNWVGKIAPIAPLGMAGMAYLGSKKTRKDETKSRKEHKREYEREREEMGFNRPWKPLEHRERRINPRYGSESDIERRYGIIREPYYLDEPHGYAKGGLVKSFSKGTLVTGPGKGQDDKIKTSVPDGSYIIDASSTSMLGDGSTKAGSNVLEKFENQIKRKFPKSFSKNIAKEISTKSSQVPVWLSEGEYKIAPLAVTMLGHGSNKKGADLLKRMVIKLRKHKISKGDDLPPKAKHPLDYI